MAYRSIATRRIIAAVSACAIGAVMNSVPLASAAGAVDLKIAHFVTPKHSVSIWIENWAKELEKKSAGKLKFKIFPGAQMGPPPKYYDLGKRGQADIVWFVHGFSPGLFPLTELSNLPYMFASAEAGIKTLNEPEVRAVLDKEHKGVVPLLLMAHQPGVIHTAKKPVKKIEDLKGMRMRFSSATIRQLISKLGATPVGMPPTQIAESMQKGTLDGAFIDYGGAGIGFKMGPVTKYTTEIYAFSSTFCICMNERKFKSLPKDMQALIVNSMKGVEKEVGHAWDKLDPLGKKVMVKAGMTPIRLSEEEDKRFRAVGQQVIDEQLAMLEKRGLPAKKVYALIKKHADKHNASSRNFWKEK